MRAIHFAYLFGILTVGAFFFAGGLSIQENPPVAPLMAWCVFGGLTLLFIASTVLAERGNVNQPNFKRPVVERRRRPAH